MHCPLCGSTLEITPPPEPPEIDWSLSGAKLDKANDAYWRAIECRRSECTCPKGCFQKDFPLYYHHPNSIDAAPGDSWSLSWVK